MCILSHILPSLETASQQYLSFQVLGERNSHLILHKVLKPVRVYKVNLGCPQPQGTTPTFTANGISLLMPPHQETEKSLSKKTHQKQNKQN